MPIKIEKIDSEFKVDPEITNNTNIKANTKPAPDVLGLPDPKREICLMGKPKDSIKMGFSIT